jgi:hypothetical protein
METNNNGTTRIKPQGTIWKDLALDPKLYYYRATLDYYGVLTQYSHPRDTKAKQGWTIMRYVPDNICTAISNEIWVVELVAIIAIVPWKIRDLLVNVLMVIHC